MWAQRCLRRLPIRQLGARSELAYGPAAAVYQVTGDETTAACGRIALPWGATTCFGNRAASSSCGPPALDPEQEKASQEIDTLLKAAAKDGKLDKLFKVIDEEGEQFLERNVTTAFCKLGQIGAEKNEAGKQKITSDEQFQTLVDMVLLGVRRYTPGSLLAITDACGKLGFDDDMLLDKVTTRLLGAIPDMDADGLHTLVTSLGDLSSPSIVLFEALQVRAEELGDELTAEQKQELQDAYKRLGYDSLAEEAGGS